MNILLNILLFYICEGLKEVPESILYHELVDYSTSDLQKEHHRHRRNLASFLRLSFTAYNRQFNLKLSRNNDVFTDDVKFTTPSENDAFFDFYSLVKGTVNDDHSSQAHGSVHDGVFEGVIAYGNETYHLEPSHKYYENPDKHSLIYKLSDLKIDEHNNKCGVKDEHHKHPPHFSLPKPSLLEPNNEGKYKYHQRRKREGEERKTKFCPLYMAADNKFYSQHSRDFAPAIYSKLGTYVEEINRIYSETIFPTYGYQVKFLIKRAHVYTTTENQFDSNEYAVARFLDLFSTKSKDSDSGELIFNHNEYCIAYMFTHRDFEDGVLGLAWVASSGVDSGGLCTSCKSYDQGKERCLNTGIVTTKNVKEVPAMQSYLTFGHELGHNLGSPHDPASCSPGNNFGGNYLMYPHANTGNNPNNKKLSSCSTEIMGPILSSRAQCFKEHANLCGDLRKDEGEQCDCGDGTICIDKCCDSTTCQFNDASYKCSQMDGVCCNPASCTPYGAGAAPGILCSEETECREAVKCKPDSFICPDGDDAKDYWKANTNGELLMCNKGTQLCSLGRCDMTLCQLDSAEGCQCTEDADKCRVCCTKVVNGVSQCMVGNNTDYFPNVGNILNETNTYLQPGSVCGNDMGYCDIMNVCRIVDADGPLASLGNYIFNGVLFDSAKNLAREYWYYCIMVAIGTVLFMAAFIAVCSKTVKPAYIPRAGERMSYPVGYNKNANSMEMRHHHL